MSLGVKLSCWYLRAEVGSEIYGDMFQLICTRGGQQIVAGLELDLVRESWEHLHRCTKQGSSSIVQQSRGPFGSMLGLSPIRWFGQRHNSSMTHWLACQVETPGTSMIVDLLEQGQGSYMKCVRPYLGPQVHAKLF